MHTTAKVAGPILVLALGLTACGGDDGGAGGASPTMAPSVATSGTVPESRNGTLPTFSDPTTIDNPWFPVTELAHSVLEGDDQGAPYRVELTLLPETRTITWTGGTTEVVEVRQVGVIDGVMHEEAHDFFAQADDGGVWYFGEAVDNYDENGRLSDHDGAWMAGQDSALPAVLFPGEPAVGTVYYSEDIPALDISERDEIVALDATAETPDGTVHDGVRVAAVQADGVEEEKIFARGFGAVFEQSPDSTLRLIEVTRS